jgi:ubiquitin-conjugating enzyme E2 J2
MATKAAHKRLTREYASISANPPPYIVAHPSESNILEWHYILTGPPKTPYEGGQYWGTLVFPSDYPFAPPAIRMHTPSGRFRCSERLCLSISDFHPKSFNPAWEVSTILLGVLSFMTSEEMTTGSLSATDAERKALAARTRWWNSTGGGSTSRVIAGQQTQSSNSRGFGAIKAGDGGKRFKEHWPELDEQNWKWMEENKIDPQTGKSLEAKQTSCSPETDALRKRVGTTAASGLGAVVDGGREAGAAGQGFVRRNVWYIVIGVLFAYVLAARVLSEQ